MIDFISYSRRCMFCTTTIGTRLRFSGFTPTLHQPDQIRIDHINKIRTVRKQMHPKTRSTSLPTSLQSRMTLAEASSEVILSVIIRTDSDKSLIASFPDIVCISGTFCENSCIAGSSKRPPPPLEYLKVWP